MDVKNFIKAARLRTLPLSISGIIMGSFLGSHYNFLPVYEKYFDTTICVSEIPLMPSP